MMSQLISHIYRHCAALILAFWLPVSLAAPINLSDTASQRKLDSALSDALKSNSLSSSDSYGLSDLDWLNQTLMDGLYVQGAKQQILGLIGNNDFIDAELAAKNWIAERPEDPAGHHLYALALLGQHKDLALTKHLTELQRLAPQLFSSTAFIAATGYAKQNRLFKALEVIDMPVNSSEAKLLKAQILFKQGHNEAASQLLKQVMTLDPNNLAATVFLTKISLSQSNLYDAEKYAEHWQRLDPEHPGGPLILSAVAMINNDLVSAKRSIARVLELHPENYVAMLDLALIEWRQGNVKQSKLLISRLDEINSREPQQLKALISLTEQSADSDKIITRLMRLDPADPLHQLLSFAYKGVENEQQLKSLIPLYFDMSEARVRTQFLALTKSDWLNIAYGYYLFRQGYFQMATEAPIKHDNSLAQINLSRSLWKGGNAEEALRQYKKLKESNPTLLIPELEVADIAFHQGDLEKALAGYRVASAKAPESLDLKGRLANLAFSAGSYEEALKTYQEMEDKLPGNPIVKAQIALSYLALNQNQSALTSITKAHQIAPQFGEVTKIYARTQFHNQQLDKAIENYLASQAQHASLELEDLLSLAKIYERKNNEKEEQRYLELALDQGQPFDEELEAKKRLAFLISKQPL
ncbi:tetratricopeptide repeat protein [Corallincola platygyrae]|uniref:Tetratricopeptide repeat protein n=1 Tax=Corallincola platygyrae TaxID=1193278 RepID=A0ABW4XNX5_9GAMM